MQSQSICHSLSLSVSVSSVCVKAHASFIKDFKEVLVLSFLGVHMLECLKTIEDGTDLSLWQIIWQIK